MTYWMTSDLSYHKCERLDSGTSREGLSDWSEALATDLAV